MATTVTRDRAWIEREYGRDKWPAVCAQIDALTAQGETSLARLVGRLNWLDADRPGLSQVETSILGRAVTVPAGLAYPGFYALIRSLLLHRCETVDPDLILELGSGWGRNLFDLWLNGGPRDARYVAAEYVEAGRDCTQRLAALEPALNLDATAFDYYTPDFSAIPSGRRTLVCTVFSVDQIPEVSAVTFERALELGEQVWGLHLEPFGWQCRDELGSAGLTGSSPVYAARHDYNRNFWPVMRGLEQRKLIEIEAVVPDIYGANAENAASLLLWRKV